MRYDHEVQIDGKCFDASACRQFHNMKNNREKLGFLFSSSSLLARYTAQNTSVVCCFVLLFFSSRKQQQQQM